MMKEMKKIILKIAVIVSIFITVPVFFPAKIYAAACNGRGLCSDFFPGFKANVIPPVLIERFEKLQVVVDGLEPGKEYKMYVDCGPTFSGNDYADSSQTDPGTKRTFEWSGLPYEKACFDSLTGTEVKRDLCLVGVGAGGGLICSPGYYQIISKDKAEKLEEKCVGNFTPYNYPAVKHLQGFVITGLQKDEFYTLMITGPGISFPFCSFSQHTDNQGNFTIADITKSALGFKCIQEPGNYVFTLQAGLTPGFLNPNVCKFTKKVLAITDDPDKPPSGTTSPITPLEPEECNIRLVCAQYDESCKQNNPASEHDKCCRKWEEKPGIQTALGCFPTQPQDIIQWILKYSIIFAGGIGFLLMLFASFQIMTSGGDPEKLKAGQELLGSAIMGILLIVFSLFILRFIGADILKIPGWE